MLRPTLNSILKGYEKTVTQLEELVKANNSKVEIKNQMVARLQDEVGTLTFESKKADKIRDNISSILEV